MKKIIKLFLCLIIMFSFFSESIWARRKRHRSASGGSGLKSSTAKKNTSTKKKQKASSTSKGKKSSSKKSSSSKQETEENEEPQISQEEQCMIDNIPTLLEGDCKFLNEQEILEGLSNKFYCIYNYKDKNKIDSVYNYYLYQKYGIKNTSLKDSDAEITIRNQSKGASKYYEFLINKLEDGTLSENRVLDFLTEDIIYEGIYFSSNEEQAISSILVNETTIPANIMKGDVENCEKAIKSTVKQCNINSNKEMQDKIEESCLEYETALIKQTATIKNKLLDMKSKLAEVLKQRVNLISRKAEVENLEKELKKKEKEAKSSLIAEESIEISEDTTEKAETKEETSQTQNVSDAK